MKHLLTLTFLSIFGLTFAQIPSYVPSNGLVGWRPFNSNANDESGNENNGTVNGATLSTDRNGNVNSAYNFNGLNNLIRIPHQNALNLMGDYSISFWYKGNYQNLFNNNWVFIAKRDDNGNCCSPNVPYGVFIPFNNTNYAVPSVSYANGNYTLSIPPNTSPILLDQWQNLIITNTSDVLKLYINGQIIFSETLSNSLRAPNTSDLLIGSVNRELGVEWMNGSLDDIGIWNRALTEAEILALYEGCQLAITTQPQDQSVATSVGTASFAAASSSANAIYQWQTNLGLGYQNLSTAGQYSGATSALLTVSNLSMANNNQVFRCIVNDGSCGDTTAEATLTIIDDAGIQNNSVNSLKLYPNPVQDVIHIDGLAGKEFEYEVLSIDGKLLQKGKSQGEIAVKELRKGNYVLRIGQQQVSFVKQ